MEVGDSYLKMTGTDSPKALICRRRREAVRRMHLGQVVVLGVEAMALGRAAPQP